MYTRAVKMAEKLNSNSALKYVLYELYSYECNVLQSNVDFYLKFNEFSKLEIYKYFWQP